MILKYDPIWNKIPHLAVQNYRMVIILKKTQNINIHQKQWRDVIKKKKPHNYER